ncbi:hypothetical protein IW261DRAFT_1160647 [Armillaria novae-zelandiae]|uniref:Uncharacterized protein n=1 Tax=Armillaria novae-zelandiae TaxID=153914 RepID=A0AA39NHJ2_9AGAR|nr:hypothetical protein IW261DRAFT_1160647 [Armillaria novae-zelandiae]
MLNQNIFQLCYSLIKILGFLLKVLLSCMIILPLDKSLYHQKCEGFYVVVRGFCILLSHTCKIYSATRAFQQGVNLAVTSIWPAYSCYSLDTVVHSPNHRWINTLTAVDADQQSQPVHLNLLTGLLLINGKPLGRLPKDITSHATYVRIFGTKILDIVPSDKPGIEYATRLPILGWQVYLGLRNDVLIVQTKKDDILLELIPHTTFNHDLPCLFIEEYTHWINLNPLSTEIEIRPLVSLWQSSPQNWRMIFNAPKREMLVDRQKMVDIHSQTFKMISGCLQNFEKCHYIHIMYNVHYFIC